MNRTTTAKIKSSILKAFHYQFLIFRDFLGNFDNDFSSKLTYFQKSWHLQHQHNASPSKFNLFVEKELQRSTQSLTLIMKERAIHLMFSIFCVIGTIVMVVLYINLAFTLKKIFSSGHYWSFLCIGMILIISCTVATIYYINKGKSSIQRETTIIRYQSFLKDLLKNKRDASVFMQQMQNKIDNSKTIIDLTPAQLVAFLNAMFKNIVISSPFTNKELMLFFENQCQQSNGEPFQNLQSLYSKYKNEDRDIEIPLTQFISKLKN